MSTTGTTAPRQSGISRRATAVDVGIVGALATATGLIRLGTKSLWRDEGYSALEADVRGTHNFLLAWYHGDPNMTLYYLLLHLWSYFGTTEADLRSLSVVFAAAGAAMTYFLGAELGGRRVGLTSGVLVAVSSFAVSYAQDARCYSLLLLLTATSTFLFLRTLHDDRRRIWVGYALTTAAGCYVHYFMGTVITTQIVYYLLTRERGSSIKPQLRNISVIGLLVLPIAVHAVRYGDGGILWIAPTTATAVLHVGYSLAGGRVMFAFLAVALVVAALTAWRRRSTDEGRAALLVGLGVLTPVVIGIVVSALITPVIINRYFAECMPFVAIALSMAIWRLPRPSLSLVVLGVVAGFSVASLVGWYDRASLEDWRSAAHYIVATTSPKTQILTSTPGEALQYYLERDDERVLNQIKALPRKCQSQAPPLCVGIASDVLLITGGSDDERGQADMRALDDAGFVAGPTRTFAGPLEITYYERDAP